MRRISSTILVLLLAVAAWSQPRLHQPEIYIGAHGGATASMALFYPSVAGTEDIVGKTFLGANGGLVFRYAGHKCCALQVEVNYMQRGWRENISNTEGLDVHYTRTLDYIEVPIMSHIFFGKKMVRGFVNIGPQIGVCFKEISSGTQHPTQQAQYAPIANIVDWGVAGGLGILVRTPKAGVFQLEARFGYSFGNYYKNSPADYFSASNPIDLSLNLGYLWEIKPKQRNKTTNITL